MLLYRDQFDLKYSKQTPHSSSMMATLAVSFMSTNADICASSVYVVLYWIPCYAEPSYNGTQQYKHTLEWRHNGRDSVSNHQSHDCLLNRSFMRRSKKTSKFRAIGLCEGNSSVTAEFLAQMASNAEFVSIWLRHHDSGQIHICHTTLMGPVH